MQKFSLVNYKSKFNVVEDAKQVILFTEQY